MPKQNPGETDNHYYARCRHSRPAPCFVLRTKSGWITDSGRVTRDINQKGGAVSFTSREAAEKYRAAYVSPKWLIEIEEL